MKYPSLARPILHYFCPCLFSFIAKRWRSKFTFFFAPCFSSNTQVLQSLLLSACQWVGNWGVSKLTAIMCSSMFQPGLAILQLEDDMWGTYKTFMMTYSLWDGQEREGKVSKSVKDRVHSDVPGLRSSYRRVRNVCHKQRMLSLNTEPQWMIWQHCKQVMTTWLVYFYKVNYI